MDVFLDFNERMCYTGKTETGEQLCAGYMAHKVPGYLVKSMVKSMSLQQLMREKGLSRYRLSKNSGIPWATLSNICYGKTRPDRCEAQTLEKLSAALDISKEEFLALEIMPDRGKLQDASYLETGLPDFPELLDESCFHNSQ